MVGRILDTSKQRTFHRNTRKEDNILSIHSFAVGGDGKVYECRGFNVVGAHAPNYNTNGLGIVLLGDFQSKRKLIYSKN